MLELLVIDIEHGHAGVAQPLNSLYSVELCNCQKQNVAYKFFAC